MSDCASALNIGSWRLHCGDQLGVQHRVEPHEILVYCMFIILIDKCTLTDFRDGYFLQPVTETSAKVNEENVLSGKKNAILHKKGWQKTNLVLIEIALRSFT